MGTAEARNRQRPCESDGVLRRPLLVDSNEDVHNQGNLKRKAETG